ncbi:hypothetical protein PENTCL1PPCAC_20864, partial [Pristionchus entomophagus]
RSCFGDLCVLSYFEEDGRKTSVRKGCAFGGFYAELKGQCVKDHTLVECICSDFDFCNNELTIISNTTLVQLNQINCFTNYASFQYE